MPHVTARELRRLRAANDVAREVRFLVQQDGLIHGNNCEQMCRLINVWIKYQVNETWTRPEVKKEN